MGDKKKLDIEIGLSARRLTKNGAGDEARTRNFQLGKLTLYIELRS
jgi:hypothetical protein